ncbi:MAG: hypothetical protein ACI4XM_08995 [Candidatus Coprovivens sp.]
MYFVYVNYVNGNEMVIAVMTDSKQKADRMLRKYILKNGLQVQSVNFDFMLYTDDLFPIEDAIIIK